MTLGLIPEILNAVDVIFLVGKQLGMVDAVVFKFAYIEHVVSPPAIGIDDAIRDYFALDNWDQRRAGCVRDNLRIHTATAL